MSGDLELEKRKYLKRAKQLLQKSDKPIKRIQASVGPFLHYEITKGTCAGIARSNSDPTALLIQRVTPTIRSDLVSSAEPLTSGFAKFAAPSKLHASTSKTTAPAVLHGEKSGTSGKSDSEENPIPSPSHNGVNNLHLSDYMNDPNHRFSSTPLPRNRGYSNQLHFTTESSQTQLSMLNRRCSELESRLKIQTDINKELKRLLVASMGSDLQHRLNQIAEEKVTISGDLDASLQRLVENDEEIDRVSIECDIWRSKYLASRLMIDELAGWEAEVTRQLRESQRALQLMLNESAELSISLIQCNYHLNEIGARLRCEDGNLGDWSADYQDCTVLEVARVASCKARDLGEQMSVMDGVGILSAALGVGNRVQAHGTGKATAGERLAKQVLKGSHQSYTLCASERNKSPPLEEQLHPSGRYQRLSSPSLACTTLQQYRSSAGTARNLLFHCNKCKGKIYNV